MSLNPSKTDSLIRRTRIAQGMSLSQVAGQMGVSKQEVSMWELRKRKFNIHQLVKLGEILNLKIEEIINDLNPELCRDTQWVSLSPTLALRPRKG